MAAKEKAFVLDTDASGYTGGEGVHFGDFPGVWTPEQPIAISELGFASADEARATVKELELPLKEVSVDAGSAPMPERPNHATATEVADETDETDEAEASTDPDAHEGEQ